MLLLGVVVTEDERGRSIPLAEYVLGLAIQNLVLQAMAEGLATHQMGGFDREAARAAFELPAQAQPVVVVALGKLGDPELLPEDLRERELAARSRKPLSEIAFSGAWGTPTL
jgi:nitroreductase